MPIAVTKKGWPVITNNGGPIIGSESDMNISKDHVMGPLILAFMEITGYDLAVSVRLPYKFIYDVLYGNITSEDVKEGKIGL